MTEATRAAAGEVLDPDFVVAAYFVPAQRRQAALAVMGFADGLARVALQVREPLVAQIRYAWWREQVDAIHSGREVHAPLMRQVREAVVAHGLPRAPFDAMVDAHALDCEAVPFADSDRFLAYCRDTMGSLLVLLARVLGAEGRADAACAHAGLAAGASAQLEGFAYWRHHRRLRLPADGFLRHGLSETDVFAGPLDPDVLATVVGPVQALIRAELGLLNACRFPRAATPALALASLARRAVQPSFDVTNPGEATPLQRVARLALANLLWRF